MAYINSVEKLFVQFTAGIYAFIDASNGELLEAKKMPNVSVSLSDFCKVIRR